MRPFLLAAALAAASPALAQDPPRTLTVQGAGQVERQPDTATLTLAVDTTAPTAQEASQANARAMTTLRTALRRARVADDDIRTVGYELFPQYGGGDDPRGPVITGYRAVNRLQVEIDDLDRVGRITDAAIAAGGNRVEGLSFSLADRDAAEVAALQDAVADARRKAEALAASVGARLGPVRQVAEGGGGFPQPFPVAYDRALEASVTTPIDPGPLTIPATVSVTWDLLAP